jgi:hypothetical protein
MTPIVPIAPQKVKSPPGMIELRPSKLSMRRIEKARMAHNCQKINIFSSPFFNYSGATKLIIIKTVGDVKNYLVFLTIALKVSGSVKAK